jgi:hypothetical protein
MYVLVVDSLKVIAESPEPAEDHTIQTQKAIADGKKRGRNEISDDDADDDFAALLAPTKRARTN